MDKTRRNLLFGVIKLKGSCCIAVEGRSMVPTLYPGTQVILREASEPVAGDIVVFHSSGHRVIHRIYKRKLCEGGVYFLTKGDSVFRLDPPVPACDVLGVVSEVKRNAELKEINTPAARALWAAIMPVQLLIGRTRRLIPLNTQKKIKDISLRLISMLDLQINKHK